MFNANALLLKEKPNEQKIIMLVLQIQIAWCFYRMGGAITVCNIHNNRYQPQQYHCCDITVKKNL